MHRILFLFYILNQNIQEKKKITILTKKKIRMCRFYFSKYIIINKILNLL